MDNPVSTELGEFFSSLQLSYALQIVNSYLDGYTRLKPLPIYGQYKIYNYCSLFLRKWVVYHIGLPSGRDTPQFEMFTILLFSPYNLSLLTSSPPPQRSLSFAMKSRKPFKSCLSSPELP